MDCPKCKTKMAEFQDGSRVILDFCGKGCHGIWFDKSELLDYTSHTQNLLPFEQLKGKAQKTEMKCPRCPDETLLEVKPFQNSELLIDFCSSCHGVFLDSKELGAFRKIASSVESLQARMTKAKEELEKEGYLVLSA